MFVVKDKKKGGPYWSPSNQDVLGILGTSRPITYFDGQPRGELFLDDGLHLNAAGYALWRGIVAPYLD